MFEVKYFLEGLLIGCAYAMPIGTQNIFVIHSAATQELRRSFKTAFIVSLMDVSLAVACFFGIGMLVDKWNSLRLLLVGTGTIFLFYYGYRLLTQDSEIVKNEKKSNWDLKQVVRAAFVLTWFNPHALLDGSILFGGYRATLPPSGVVSFLIGILIASPLWFFSITTVIGGLKQFMSQRVFNGINRLCGIALIIFGTKFLSLFIRTAL